MREAETDRQQTDKQTIREIETKQTLKSERENPSFPTAFALFTHRSAMISQSGGRRFPQPDRWFRGVSKGGMLGPRRCFRKARVPSPRSSVTWHYLEWMWNRDSFFSAFSLIFFFSRILIFITFYVFFIRNLFTSLVLFSYFSSPFFFSSFTTLVFLLMLIAL